jgi:hypothetical protein
MATTATDLDTLKQALYDAFNKDNALADDTRKDTFEARQTVAAIRTAAVKTAMAIITIEQSKGPSVRK